MLQLLRSVSKSFVASLKHDSKYIQAKYTYGNETSNVTEWYSVYFLTECVGNIANDGVTKVNTTCYKYPSPESDFNLQKSFIPWTIGVAFAGFDALLLPVFFGGRIYWNGWMLFFLWVRRSSNISP
jgi:hypothetical protein